MNFNLSVTTVTCPPTQSLSAGSRGIVHQVQAGCRITMSKRPPTSLTLIRPLYRSLIKVRTLSLKYRYIYSTLQTFSPSPVIYQRRLSEGVLEGGCEVNFQSSSPIAKSSTTCNAVPLCSYAKVFPRNFPSVRYFKKRLNHRALLRSPTFPINIC